MEKRDVSAVARHHTPAIHLNLVTILTELFELPLKM
jgi:hypothetical protein